MASPDAAAAECERAPGDSATEPAAAWSSDAAESAYTRAPGDSATEPAAVSSPAPDAAAAECERAPGDSATEPAAASSPAPDAAAAECERAPGDAAACAHGDKKAAAPELYFSTADSDGEFWNLSAQRAGNLCRVFLRKKRR